MKRLRSVGSVWILGMALLAGSAPALAAQEGLTCNRVPQLMAAFLYSHIQASDINEELQKRTAEAFLNRMDPSRVLLLKKEREEWIAKFNSVYPYLRQGKCGVFNELQKVLATKQKEMEDYVRAFVGDKNYKLDETVEIVEDPDKRGSPETPEHQKDLIRKLVHFQISNYLSSDEKLPEAKKRLIHRYELFTKRIQEQKPEDLYSSFVGAFAMALDPHSAYLSPDVLEDFNIGMRLSLEGIGVLLTSQDGYTLVEEIIPGGAADRVKALLPKDKIIAVTQTGKKPVNIIDMDLRDVVKLIRGKKGTVVTLTVLRQGDKTERLDVKITRDKIDLADQAAKLEFETRKIEDRSYKVAIIELPSFYGDEKNNNRTSYRDVERLLKKVNEEKVDGLILDLSRNGGGLLSEAVRISGLFLRKGGIVAVKHSKNEKEVLNDTDSKTVYNGPLVVLTSRLSASASEILAGALKDYGRAVIVGDDHTFGKGTVQAVIPISNELGAIKVTTGMFFRPEGRSTQHTGVKSDVVLPSLMALDEIGEKSLDYSLPEQQIESYLSPPEISGKSTEWRAIDTGLISKLTAKSLERTKKDEAFRDIEKQLAERRKNAGVIRLADIRKQEIEDAKKDRLGQGEGKGKKKPPYDKAKKRVGKLGRDKNVEKTPQLLEAVNILVDYVQMTASTNTHAAK